MKTKYFFLSLIFFLGSMAAANAQEEFDFTITGSCASYIEWHNSTSLQADSIYSIQKTASEIVIDAVAEEAWNKATAKPIAKIAHGTGVLVNLSKYPQTEAYQYAVFRALWTADGVYMFISVKDEYPRYQNVGSAWENDAIEFFFAKARGESKKQIIIPCMVGTTDPSSGFDALNFESGSGKGSQPTYTVFGYDNDAWDESLFTWAIKRTTDGWDMEVYMDKDIVTNGNSSTNFGLDKVFAGDINIDVAGLSVNNSLANREGTLCMLGNDVFEFNTSANYGYFKLVDNVQGIDTPEDVKFNASYNSDSKEIKILSSTLVSSVEVYNVAGQVIPTRFNNSTVSLLSIKQGIYLVKAKDLAGNNLGLQKIVVY